MTAPSAAARRALRFALGLWLLIFAVESGLARQLHARHVLSTVDTLFNADAGWFLVGFADGRGTGTSWGGRSMVHPNVANWVNPPVRLAAHLCTAVRLCDTPAPLARRQVATFVAPALAATEAALLFLAASLMFRPLVFAFLGAAVNAVLFPSVIFGALPESYALSGCAFAALFYLVTRTATGLAVGSAWWIAVGAALAGVTVTNLLPFALLVWLAQRQVKGPPWSPAIRTIGLSAAAGLVTVVLAGAITAAYGSLDDYWSGPLRQRVEIQVSPYRPGTESFGGYARWQLRKVLARAAGAFPVALGNTLLPGLPSVRRSKSDEPTHGSAAEPAVPHAQLEITFEEARGGWGTVFTLIAIAGALCCAFALPHRHRLVYQAAAVLVGFNWAFHSVFGAELFLYAKHWTVGLAVLLWAWMHLARPTRNSGAVVLAVLLIAAVIRDIQAVQWILRTVP